MEFVRGNTKAFYFARHYKGGTVIKDKADQLYFTVKRYPEDDSEVLLQKTIEDMTFDNDGNYHITLNPSDTEELDFGTYYYDLKVIVSDYKKTLKLDEFKLTNECTDKGNEG